jgi:hypothetical protein
MRKVDWKRELPQGSVPLFHGRKERTLFAFLDKDRRDRQDGERRNKEPAMIDVTTNKPMRVSNAYPPRPSLEVALSQLEELQYLLDRHGLRYEVLENAISMNDGPFTTDVIFSRGTDADAVQAILDSVT